MKLILLTLAAVLSFHTFAGDNGSYFYCSNNVENKASIEFSAVSIFFHSLEFVISQQSFSIDINDVEHSGNDFRFVNKAVKVTAHGKTSKSVVNGLVVLSSDQESITLDLNINNGETQSLQLTCSEFVDESDL